jgi:hypothetical protein
VVIQFLAHALGKILLLVFASVLLASFGLHTIDIHHSHGGAHHAQQEEQPYEGASSIDEYAHTGDKKLFMLLVLSFLWFGLLIASRNSTLFLRVLSKVVHSVFTRLRKWLANLNCAIVNWLTWMYTQGHLNPKLH